MKETVLVVEDDPSLRQFLNLSLSMHGYSVVEADCGEIALLRARQCNPDAILLDYELPDLNGVEITRKLRREVWTPILFVSVHEDEKMIVQALDAGADDYLVKPFRLPELLARLRAAMRRGHVPLRDGILMCGKLRLDQDARTVAVDGQRISLTPNEFGILQVLMQHQGRVVNRRELLSAVWGEGSTTDPHILRVHVSNLRKKLEVFDTLPRYLTNEPGMGYRLAAPPEDNPGAAGSPLAAWDFRGRRGGTATSLDRCTP